MCRLVTTHEDGERVVTVLPISHDPKLAVEIPAPVKRRLKLDDERSWVVLTEANRFVWPGPDLRPLTPGDSASVGYGPLPFALFEEIRKNSLPRSKRDAPASCRAASNKTQRGHNRGPYSCG